MRLKMLIRSPLILYRQTAVYWLKESSLLPSRLIIQRTLTNKIKLLKMPPTQIQQQNEMSEIIHLQPLLVEVQTGDDKGILLAKMNVPRTKNALSRALVNQFRETVDRLRYDSDVRVLIIQSSVPGAFCSGADLKERRQMTEIEVFQFVDFLRRTFNEISALPFPVIAAIDGVALGGGLELAMACDIRIASPQSKLGLVETKLAIIPGAGGTQRLPRIVGLAKAKELIFTGKILTGSEALDIGLGPIASKMAKIALDRGSELELASGMVVEQQCYAQIMPTKDRLEALKAFAEKREPKYKGE
ncbi:hypothetical protein Mgra_00002624 [Meloidogyne graminicola]|uniref:Enoyl-CoA hydratase n=1 Tax=Meloidogyne graminicola TaxID=189291 RepID=A0A8S9ZXB4_9BILA|nr:hypothetical protein Mgra_00002624 [Meloidogyne graminicola]